MADLGAISLWIALALSSYAAIGSVVGRLRGVPALVASSQQAVYLLALVMLVSTLSLVGAFINRDFEVAYVAAHSNLAMPNIYTGWPSTPATRAHFFLSGSSCQSCRPWPCGLPRNRCGTPFPTPPPC